VVRVLLQHGLFTPVDTAATAAVMRMYALGLLGQAMVGVLCRPFFTGTGGSGSAASGAARRPGAVARPGWYPAAAMGAGLAVTTAVAVTAAPRFGGPAIAAANAAGITVTAVLLLLGLRKTAVRVPLPEVASDAARLVAAAAGAGGAGWLADRALAGLPSIVDVSVGGLVVLATFAALARLTRAGWPWTWC
jgi:putative peptidoglycan lipid II flippase